MDSLQANYKEEDEEEEGKPNTHLSPPPAALPMDTTTAAPVDLSERKDGAESSQNDVEPPQKNAEPPQINNSSTASASESLSESDPTTSNDTEKPNEDENENEEEDEDDPPPKKQKQLSSLEDPTKTTTPAMPPIQNDATDANNDVKTLTPTTATATATKKKAKKKNNNNVWVTKSTRKGKKKAKPNPLNTPTEDTVLITPVPRFPDKNDDSPDMKICLSKVYKAEKVELSEDRMSAGSTKGYRMVRATRGVCEGAWYFEVKVVNLGDSGHTRLGWSTEKGDLQAPVGYDGNSFGYRDVDGSKVHKALREKYGEEGYKEGDVIGFYINLPGGEHYSPKKPQFVWHKGQRYACAADAKEDPLKVVPGSEISFFRNGVCQGVAFKDVNGGRYYPAASMYTLPNQPNCLVKFNFGPDFEFYPEDFGGRPVPRPMVEVRYHGFDSRVENGVSNEKKH